MDFGPVHKIAAGQRALVTFEQLQTAGLSRHQIERLSGQGLIIPSTGRCTDSPVRR